MQLKLKESPREWQKFVGVMSLLACLLVWLLIRKGALTAQAWVPVGALIATCLIASWIKPGWFRGFYRAGMTASFHVGQVVGRVVLTVLFLLVVTPMGWVLRACGKDLLGLRHKPDEASHWHKARDGKDFKRMF